MGTLVNIKSYHFILWNLILKDFKIRYRSTFLGIFWSLLNPLVMIVVLTIVFSYIMRSPVENFPIFLLVGLISWNFFALTLPSATSSIVDNSVLIKKVVFAREILPISIVFANLIHFFINLGLLFLFILIYHIQLGIAVFFFPVILAIQLIFMFGASLFCAGLNVYYRDMRYIVESLIFVLFWLTPIFYPLSFVPKKFLPVYLLNPMAGLITSYRAVFLEGRLPDPIVLGSSAIVSCIILVVGIMAFRRYEKSFADLT